MENKLSGLSSAMFIGLPYMINRFLWNWLHLHLEILSFWNCLCPHSPPPPTQTKKNEIIKINMYVSFVSQYAIACGWNVKLVFQKDRPNWPLTLRLENFCWLCYLSKNKKKKVACFIYKWGRCISFFKSVCCLLGSASLVPFAFVEA